MMIKRTLIALALIALVTVSTRADAAGMGVIRDEEIEQ